MANPFFLPDPPDAFDSGSARRPSGKLAMAFVFASFGIWVCVSIAAILLTLSDALPRDRSHGIMIAELE